MTKIAFVGIGANLGQKKDNIETAMRLLDKNKDIDIYKTSSFYETEPVGYTDQDWFLNVVIKIETSLSPYELLSYCQEIENILKRERIIRWGPRTVDLDILLYEDFISKDEKLTVPHPRMKERAFAMIPLYEIEKDILIDDENIKDIVGRLKRDGIYKLEERK